MGTTTEDMLKEAVKGLRYRSEADEPFEVVSWAMNLPELDPKAVLKQEGYNPSTPTETIRVEDFFEGLVKDEPWHGAEEEEEVSRYRQLYELVKTRLLHPRVFRIGKIKIDIFILGMTGTGNWAGLKTKAVET